MKIYGSGPFTAPGSSRVVWDFEDGPFDTVNPVLIEEAKRRGYSFTPPPPPPEPVRRKPGRPAKEAVVVHEVKGPRETTPGKEKEGNK
ncbi:MAG: hypothetical protein IMZ62_16660 [Chloroflexi bacterium]|nr:hypothetical protein [Chloroflexota bacterium]